MLKSEPLGKNIKAEFGLDESFHPVSIKGDWIQVEWMTIENKKERGWFKWRDGNQLVIELFPIP